MNWRVPASLVGALFALQAATITLSTTGCAPTDTGNPPLDLDHERVEGTGTTGLVRSTVEVMGRASAVVPAEGDAILMFLDRPTEFTRQPVEGDGSFDLTLDGEGVFVRMWIERMDGPLDTATSSVFDWTFEDAIFAPVPRTDSCVQVREAVRLTRGETTMVSILNECGAAISLSVTGALGDITTSMDDTVEDGEVGVIAIEVALDATLAGAVVQMTVAGAIERTFQISGIISVR